MMLCSKLARLTRKINEIKRFFGKLKVDLYRAKTVKALRILERRAVNYISKIDTDLTTPEIKKDINAEYSKVKSLITKLSRKLA